MKPAIISYDTPGPGWEIYESELLLPIENAHRSARRAFGEWKADGTIPADAIYREARWVDGGFVGAIQLIECIPGHLYWLRSRNLALGVFKDTDNGFVGVREKFYSLYLFTEYHHDTGPPFGTATPVEDLGPCPIADLAEYHHIDRFAVRNRDLFDWLRLEEHKLGMSHARRDLHNTFAEWALGKMDEKFRDGATDILHDIIADVVDSAQLAVASLAHKCDSCMTDPLALAKEVRLTVEDYVANNYGDDQ